VNFPFPLSYSQKVFDLFAGLFNEDFQHMYRFEWSYDVNVYLEGIRKGAVVTRLTSELSWTGSENPPKSPENI